MTKLAQHAATLGMVLLSLIFAEAAHAQACATVTSTVANTAWNDGFNNLLYLTQNADKSITGTMQVRAGSPCVLPFRVTGTYTGNGQFTLQLLNESNPPPAGCADEVIENGSLLQPGCDQVTGSYTNNGGVTWQTLSLKLNQCIVPPGETQSVFQRWDNSNAAATWHVYLQNPLPNSGVMDWGGRTVTETFDNNGSDTCWFSGSIYAKATTGVAAPPLTLATGEGYNDDVGPGPELTNYYRQQGKAPCGFYENQTMVIDCSTGVHPYEANLLFLGIGPNLILSERNHAGQQQEYWGTPQAAYRAAPGIIDLGVIFSN